MLPSLRISLMKEIFMLESTLARMGTTFSSSSLLVVAL